MAHLNDIVQRLWSFCHILRDDGITYHQYVNELSYLLFLKMAQETGKEEDLPVGFRWADLKGRSGADQFDFYRSQLVRLGTQGSRRIRNIFANPTSLIRKSGNLNALVSKIDEIDWYSAKKEGLGDLYEGLLQKNASEKKSGAGQYFTPRPLIESVVQLLQPRSGETIQDPAAGTGGFLVVANEAWLQTKSKGRPPQFCGVELVQDTYRLLLMNVTLHGMQGEFLNGDSLSAEFKEQLAPADLILTNPPFGTKRGGGLPTRLDLPYPTANKQFAFLQHVYLGLKPGGRAAVVLPDNVLFEGNTGKQIRADLMDKCNLHTLLRLPTGIFYAQGVKTNVLFFTRCEQDKGNTKEVWVYDLRSNMPQFGKRTPLTRDHFAGFEAAFGKDPLGSPKSLAKRKDTGEEGRFRKFTREWIAERGESLDIAWLKDESDGASDELPEPAVLAREAMTELEVAFDELRGILAELGEDIEEVEA
ncbi:class I SAM-dependent DNA methyltransferase [Corallococcus llansteffanensis]|uniref:site-specific DNA-methyltransferase (adenine-specific) n=1 Tax=Corallococcus llansteffanensis TaxID=2316731 RepID=A0A3A8PVE4_9BACT|nr:N-6 DNA methylase [Corallococcus llansteffanensis]RKH58871.1 SAM-dependent methyltransferase [Corallococcus llansteffanensis]